MFRGYFIEHRFKPIVLKGLEFDPFQFSTDPQYRLLTRYQVEVRSSLVMHEFEKRINLGHTVLLKNNVYLLYPKMR